MSIRALGWAFEQKIKPASAKFVLVALADVADNRTGECYPSIAYLGDATGHDRKTIIAGLATLEAAGLIVDTGQRRGRTGQVPVYRVTLSPSDTADQEKSPETGTVETVPIFPPKSPVFPSKESRKRDTDPSENHQGTNDRAKARRKTELPADWKPSAEQVQYARDHGCPDPKATAINFTEYWLSRGTRMLHWNLVWQTWCRREGQFAPRGSPTRPAQGGFNL